MNESYIHRSSQFTQKNSLQSHSVIISSMPVMFVIVMMIMSTLVAF